MTEPLEEHVAAASVVTPTSAGGDPGGIPPEPSGRRTSGRRSARETKEKKKSGWRSAAEWGALLLAALVIALIIKTFLFQAFYIPSGSMLPTLKVDDEVLVDKLAYKLHPVHRGDIVVFKAPPGTKTAEIQDLVKRVLGLPGERIEGRNGHVYIDGRLVQEPYLPKTIRSVDFQCTAALGCKDGRVPANSYFVLGDNRPESKDSHYFGPIRKSDVVGRVVVRIWPLNRIGFIGPSYAVPIVVIAILVAFAFLLFGFVTRRHRADET